MLEPLDVFALGKNCDLATFQLAFCQMFGFECALHLIKLDIGKTFRLSCLVFFDSRSDDVTTLCEMSFEFIFRTTEVNILDEN